MVTTIGMRTRMGRQKMRPDQGTRTRSRNTDKGMTKRVTSSFTFTASDGKVTGSIGDFNSNFVAGDVVQISNTNLNNGFRTMTAVNSGGGYAVLDPPPKDEGPITCTIRTP